MKPINTIIPNLINGVSQQSEAHRFATQGSAQLNAHSSPVEGLIKRHPTKHVAVITSLRSDYATFTHTINRDPTERYIMVVHPDISVTVTLANIVANTFTTAAPHPFVPGDAVRCQGFILPSGMTQDVVFYIKNTPTATTFQLSATVGGATLVVNTAAAAGDVTIAKDPISVVDLLSGAKMTVKTPDGFAYLQTSDTTTLRAISVADYTFLMNRDRTVVMNPGLSTDTRYEAFITVRQGDYGKDYKLRFPGSSNNGTFKVAPIEVPVSVFNSGTGIFQVSSATTLTNLTFVRFKCSGSPHATLKNGGGYYMVTTGLPAGQFKLDNHSAGSAPLTGLAGGTNMRIQIMPAPIACTVAVGTSTTNFNAVAHGLADGEQVFVCGETTPTGITEGSTMFVVSSAANTFKLASSYAGAAVVMSTNGVSVAVQRSTPSVLTAQAVIAGSLYVGWKLIIQQYSPTGFYTHGAHVPTSIPTPKFTLDNRNKTITVDCNVTTGTRHSMTDIYNAWLADPILSALFTPSFSLANHKLLDVGSITTSTNVSTNTGYTYFDKTSYNAPFTLDSNRIADQLAGTANVAYGTLLIPGNAEGSSGLTNVTTGLNYVGVAGHNDWRVEVMESTIAIRRGDRANFDIAVSDGLGGSGLNLAFTTVPTISNLPKVCRDGTIIKVVGRADSNDDDYYVKFVTDGDGSGDFSSGKWQETLGWALPFDIDASTMPHTLVREADGIFYLRRGAWANRLCGDDASNPVPSFVGRELTDITLYKDRLCFIAGENTVMSEAGEYFNFFRTTVRTLLDSDPVDTRASHTKVSSINYAIPYNDKLVLFSEQTQFVLTHGDIVSPKSVKIGTASEYENIPSCAPALAGKSLFFATDRAGFSGISEYSIDGDTLQMTAQDVTEHVPRYILGNARLIAASATDSILAVLSDDATSKNLIYIYKYLDNKDGRLQASWSTYDLGTNSQIVSCDFIHNVLYIVILRGNCMCLEKMIFQDKAVETNMAYEVKLDRKLSDAGLLEIWDAGANQTSINLPYVATIGAEFRIVKTNGEEIPILSYSADSTRTYLTAAGDTRAFSYYVGESYSMQYEFSKLFLRNTNDQSRPPLHGGRHQLRRGRLSFNQGVTFDVQVTTDRRTPVTYTYSAAITNEATFDELFAANRSFTFPILSDAKKATVKVLNNSPYPSAFLTLEYEGVYHARHDNRPN